MAQLSPSQAENRVKQFVYQYYHTLAYDLQKIYLLYEQYATIYRQTWQHNKPLPLSQCTDNFLFTAAGDHITILNYIVFPIRQGSLIIVNGQIDSEHGPTKFFNQVLEVEIYYYLNVLIVSDYVQFTSRPQINDPIEYFDVMPPAVTMEGKEEPKANEAPQPVVNQQTQPPAPLQPQPQSQPPQHQQQEYSAPPNRGRESYRGKGYRGRNNMQRVRGNRNDNMTDLSEKFGSSQNYYPSESSQQSNQPNSKYVPPVKSSQS